MTQLIEPLSIILIFVFSFVLIRRNTSLALYLMLMLSVLLHKELFSFYRWDLLPIRMFMFALLCSFAADLVIKIFSKAGRQQLISTYFKNPYVLAIAALWLVNGVSLFFSFNLKASLLLYGFFTTVVVLFVHILTKTSISNLKPLSYIKFYINIAFGLTLFGVFQFFLYEKTGKIVGALWNIPNNIPRIGSTFWDVNHYGAFLAALLPLTAMFVLTEKLWRTKIYYFVVSLFLLGSLLITNSRTAWIMAFVTFVTFCLVFLVVKFGKKGIIILFTPLLIASAVLGFMYSQKDSYFRAVVKQYFHYRLDSFDSHMLLLTGTFQVYQQYPILGGGYGGFFEHFSKTKIAPEFFGRDPAALNTRVPAHTIWGEVLADTGTIGFTVFLFFIGSVLLTLLYATIHTKNKERFLLNLTMFSILVGWLVAGIFYSYNSEFFWIIWALYLTYALSDETVRVSLGTVLKFFLRSDSFKLTSLLSIAALLIFWGLGNNHLIPWDEAIYAKIAKNMFSSGDFISQFWKNNSVWYEKPPLYMWLESFFMFLFGISSIAVKLPSALAGLFTVFFVFKIAKKHFNSTVAFISAISLLTTVHFLYYSRIGMLDITTTLFITWSLYMYDNAKDKKSIFGFISTGLLIGFAAMTKGVVGLLPAFIIFLTDITSQNKIKFINYLQILFGFALIALPWHIAMYIKYGNSFIYNYIGYHVVDRATSAIEDKGNPIWWYAIVLKVSMRIWFISFLAALPFAIYKSIKSEAKLRLFVIWFSFVFILFSIAKSKLVWYIIPLYPAAAIINGYFIGHLLDRTVQKFNVNKQIYLKFFTIYVMVIFSIAYLLANKNMVYPSDLTGSQARLMQLKDQTLGVKNKIYLDRIELPLALYYSNSEFEIVDFSPNNIKRVPSVDDNTPLILLTKKGRFSQTVAGYTYAPTIVAEDGDWILWFMPPRKNAPALNKL